ncbi:hypothetical protein [Halorussus salinus]|uniref:hypothetical protein n=1 Tax=Halorussus salinus TaxID=1364935 RepID=UPI001091D804|nr:hypothetical protein [Halorussus salinus]
MYSVSAHTVQINGWISLAKGNEGFSHSLSDRKYACDLIEHEFEIGDDDVHPDIILSSELDNYSIIAECKSERLDSDQLRRYKRFEKNPEKLLDRTNLDALLDSSKFGLEVCYSSLSDLSTRELLTETDTPFVQFSHSSTSGVLIENSLPFQFSELASRFPINMDPDEALPTEYYPFDVDQPEDREQFVATIIQALLRTALMENTTKTKQIVKEAHPHWDHIGSEKQSRFVDETKKVIEILERSELQEYIENVADSADKWKISPKTAQAIQKRMNGTDFVQKIAEQADFDDFG